MPVTSWFSYPLTVSWSSYPAGPAAGTELRGLRYKPMGAQLSKVGTVENDCMAYGRASRKAGRVAFQWEALRIGLGYVNVSLPGTIWLIH